MKLKKVKLKNVQKDKTNLMLFLLMCVFTLSLTVGYAIFESDVKISGEAAFRVQEDIRITDLRLFETSNIGLENYDSKFTKNTIKTGVTLKNQNSTVTYKVTVANTGSVAM